MTSSENLWNSWKSIEIHEIAGSWDRVKVSIVAGPRRQTLPSISKPRTPEIHKISWNLMKIMKIHKNPWNSSQLGSSKGFYRGRTSLAWSPIRFQTSDIQQMSGWLAGQMGWLVVSPNPLWMSGESLCLRGISPTPAHPLYSTHVCALVWWNNEVSKEPTERSPKLTHHASWSWQIQVSSNRANTSL